MNSLEAMEAAFKGTKQDTSCVQLMLKCTHEMIKRFKEVHRDKTIWRSDVRYGRALMQQFRVRIPLPTFHTRTVNFFIFALRNQDMELRYAHCTPGYLPKAPPCGLIAQSQRRLRRSLWTGGELRYGSLTIGEVRGGTESD